MTFGPLLEVEMSKKVPPRCGAKHISKSKWQKTPCSDHFWKLRCRKSARRSGAKHISNSKCAKHTFLGRTSAPRCGAKHISKSKAKNWGGGALLDVQMSFFGTGAGDCAPCQKWAKRQGFVVFQFQPPLHYTTLHYTLQLQLQLRYTYTNCTALHYATPNYTTLDYTTLTTATTTTTIFYENRESNQEGS